MLARHEAFGVAAEVHVDAMAVDALHDAGHERADAVLVFVHDLGALGFAHLLHDDLLGGLRGDAAEGDRFHRHFDEPADLGLRFDVDGIVEAQFALRKLELGGIVGEDLPATKRLVLAGLAVDLDAHVDVVAVLAPRRRCERRLERLEDDLACDALLVGDGLDDFQDLLVHGQPTNRALLIPASGNFHSFRSTSIVTLPSSTGPSRPRNRAPTLDRRRQLDPRLAAREPREVLRGPQRPVEAGRGDLEPVLVPDRVLGIEHRPDRAARPLAVVEPDSGAVDAVDVDAHQRLTPGRTPLDLEELVAEPADHRLQQAEQLVLHPASIRPGNKKWARGPFPATRSQQKGPARGPSDRPFGSGGPRPGLAARTAVAQPEPPTGAHDTAAHRTRSTRVWLANPARACADSPERLEHSVRSRFCLVALLFAVAQGSLAAVTDSELEAAANRETRTSAKVAEHLRSLHVAVDYLQGESKP